MVEADDIVIEALLDDVLDASIINDAVDEALAIVQGSHGSDSDSRGALERQIAKVEQERDRLVAAIATGGIVDGLLEALQEREKRLERLKAELHTIHAQKPPAPAEVASIRSELMSLAGSWRRVLSNDPTNARPIVAALLKGRVTITPQDERKVWELRGEGTLSPLFSGEICRKGWRPHRDSWLCGMQN